MNYAIIGTGFIAKRHIQTIKDIGSKVLITCDIDSVKNADFLNYREMLASPMMKKVDAISICTPNYLHAEMIRDSLRVKSMVICEKPLTINTDFSFMAGVYIVHQLHFHPLFNKLCEEMRTAKKIKMTFKACRNTEFWNSWKGDELKSGGVIYTFGAHLFDLLLSAVPGNYELKNIVDTNKKSTGTIFFENGPEIEFHTEFLDTREGQGREVDIDGNVHQLSIKDNLSFEGLHEDVFKAFEAGIESNLQDAIRYITLIDKIKKYGK